MPEYFEKRYNSKPLKIVSALIVFVFLIPYTASVYNGLSRIFEKGYTGCNGRADKKATGLGLYLCRRICKNLGHGIRAESIPGKGTLMRLDLNQAKGPLE